MLIHLCKRVLRDKSLRNILFRSHKYFVTVVIPIYKSGMTATEEIAFDRCLLILKRYPIIIVAPENLDLTIYLKNNNIQVLRFPSFYFDGIAGYNKLMLSSEFYKTFIDYKYILIYQLDCYVFRDELQDWCLKNYDYIGAPWIDEHYQELYYKALTEKYLSTESFWRKRAFQLFGAAFDGVGNGGLSLRKVKKTVLILTLFKNLVKRWDDNEDLFFSVIAPKLDLFYKVPNKSEALLFAFETNPTKSFALTNHHLPFGCHAWEKHEPDFWDNFIPDRRYQASNFRK